ncbi:MAG TPA: 5'/3'-nucleotidase SurE [Acidimicrobiales bacterium]|nr:5'/3'-nucleotidase SurE [Acidimicrobiales bacterium]
MILACVGGFGPRPDLVLSGINHGINVGRSAMHSGTVGAALTGAHFGLRALAVSIRWGDDPVPWETPATLATTLVPVLEGAPPGTTLNLNTPNVELVRLRGLRHGRLGRGGTIRSAVHDSGEGGASVPHVALPAGQTGTLRLDLTAPGTSLRVHPDTDAGLLARGYASLTPLVGVREAGAEADDVLEAALEKLYEIPGVSPGLEPEELPETQPGPSGEAATA